MGWSSTGADVSTSKSVQYNTIVQYPPLTQKVTTTTTVVRGLTEGDAKTLVDEKAKISGLTAKVYYGNSSTSEGSMAVVLTGTKIEAAASRADESCQWQVTITETNFASPEGTNWSATATDNIEVSTSKSISAYYAGTAYTPTYHIDISGNKRVKSVVATHYTQVENTTVKTTRVKTEPTLSAGSAYCASGGWIMKGDAEYGQIQVKSGTRITTTASKTMLSGVWIVTITTTTYSWYT